METDGQLIIKLNLTLEEVNIIQRALQELPYKISAELIFKIKIEGDKQYNKIKGK